MEAYVYILCSPGHRVLYTGVTSNLTRRIYEHQQKLVPGFTSRYNITHLVYYEAFTSIVEAIAREKMIKKKSRRGKIILIESINPTWQNLTSQI